MPKVNQEHLDARRHQILEAAFDCFAEKGFHRATMQDIVQRSGLSAGSIYRYFQDKNEIIRAITDERHGREMGLMSDAVVDADGVGQNLYQITRAFFGLLGNDRERSHRRLGIETWAEALRNPDILETVREGVDVPRKRMAALVQAAQSRGDVSPHVDCDAVARVMIAVFQGFLLQQAWDPKVQVKPYLAVLDWLLDGVVARATGERHP